jgi:hypothetical protein
MRGSIPKMSLTDSGRNDLDETRRLLYMALAVPLTDRYELVGTLVNALAHHGMGLDPDEVIDQAVRAVTGDGDKEWVKGVISEINARLG